MNVHAWAASHISEEAISRIFKEVGMGSQGFPFVWEALVTAEEAPATKKLAPTMVGRRRKILSLDPFKHPWNWFWAYL